MHACVQTEQALLLIHPCTWAKRVLDPLNSSHLFSLNKGQNSLSLKVQRFVRTNKEGMCPLRYFMKAVWYNAVYSVKVLVEQVTHIVESSQVLTLVNWQNSHMKKEAGCLWNLLIFIMHAYYNLLSLENEQDSRAWKINRKINNTADKLFISSSEFSLLLECICVNQSGEQFKGTILTNFPSLA